MSKELLEACLEGDLERVRFLVGDGKGPNSGTVAIEHTAEHIAKSTTEHTAEHTAPYTAPYTAPHTTEYGPTPLLRACQSGNVALVEFLLDMGMDVNRAMTTLSPIENSETHDTGLSDGVTPLFVACENCNVGLVSLLLRHGADIKLFRTRDRMTPISRCCSIPGTETKEMIEIVRMLLRAEAIINPKSGTGTISRSPLIYACEAGHVELVRMLINHHASLTHRFMNGSILQISCSTQTPGTLSIVNMLLNRGVDVNGAEEEGLSFPLAAACALGNVPVIQRLLSAGSRVEQSLERSKRNEETPLAYAISRGDLDVVSLLLAYGACEDGMAPEIVDLESQPENKFKPPPDLAARQDACVEMVRNWPTRSHTPIRSPNSTFRVEFRRVIVEQDVAGLEQLLLGRFDDDDNGSAAAPSLAAPSLAAATQILGIIHEVDHTLLYHAPKENGTPTTHHDTPLTWLCRICAVRMVQVVLKFLEVNHFLSSIDSPTGLGTSENKPRNISETALVVASIYGHLDVVKLLVAAGAVVDHLTRTSGYFDQTATPLLSACRNSHVEIVSYLIDSGANVDGVYVGFIDDSSPMWEVCWCESVYDHTPSERLALVTTLLEKGADIEYATEGITPLWLACQGGYIDIVTLFIEKGAKIEIFDCQGVSSLTVACGWAGSFSIAKLLIGKGANIESVAMNGTTALSDACLDDGRLPIVKLLLDHGARVEGSIENKQTPLFHACKHGNNFIVQYLLASGADANLVSEDAQLRPIVIAATNGHEACVETLLRHGADAGPHLGICPILKAQEAGQKRIAIKIKVHLARIAKAKQESEAASLAASRAASEAAAEAARLELLADLDEEKATKQNGTGKKSKSTNTKRTTTDTVSPGKVTTTGTLSPEEEIRVNIYLAWIGIGV
jgi:ankyrin repeat protein